MYYSTGIHLKTVHCSVYLLIEVNTPNKYQLHDSVHGQYKFMFNVSFKVNNIHTKLSQQ